MFIINTAGFEGRKELEFVINKGDFSLGRKEPVIEDNMAINLILTRERGSAIIVQGKINGNIRLKCGRCLKEYSQPVDTSFTAVYKSSGEFTNEDSESETRMYENNEVDFSEIIAESIILEKPMKPLCGPDCRGLCPVCGQNLNEGQCGCKREMKISPFDELDKIKFKKGKK